MESLFFILVVFLVLMSLCGILYANYVENKKESEYFNTERKRIQQQVDDCFIGKPLEYNIFTTEEFKNLSDNVARRIIYLTLKALKQKGRNIYGNNILAKEAFLNVEVDLNGCFEWNKTEEGHDYWEDLHVNYFKRKF